MTKKGYMERIKILREALNLNVADFSRQLDVPRSTLVGWEDGKSVSIGILKSLEEKFNVNIDWFLTGEGEMFCGENVKSHLEKAFNDAVAAHPKFADIESRLAALEQRLGRPPEAEPLSGGFTGDPEPEYEAEERVKVPYVHDIAAGPPIRQAEDQSQSRAVPARLVRKGGRYYAASIRGTSMTEAGIRDGDTVLVRHADTPKDGAVQVVRYKGKSTLKRLREVEGKGWELHYEDGTGTVISVDSGKYEVQGDFVAVLPETNVPD
jgi:SOS-response transcriptional repressor LexA/DNA-binding XRE family transcriptional regulator